MSHNYCSFGSPAVAFVTGKLSVWGLKDVKLQGYQPSSVGLVLSTICQECLF